MTKSCKILLFISTLLSFFGCVEYTPKPKGYFRIELPQPVYSPMPLSQANCSFDISQLASPDSVEFKNNSRWFSMNYPSLDARLYCSLTSVNKAELDHNTAEMREIVTRLSKNSKALKEQFYSNPDEKVYGIVFFLDEESPSPLQFMLTDSTANLFRGALYFNNSINPDSLNPVVEYLKNDVIELIQSFSWKK